MKIQKWDHLLAANVDPNFRLTEANTIDFPEYCTRILVQYEYYIHISSLFVFFCIEKRILSLFSQLFMALKIFDTKISIPEMPPLPMPLPFT